MSHNQMSHHSLSMCANTIAFLCSLFATSAPLDANHEVRAVLRNYKLIFDLDLAKLGRSVRYDVDESTNF